MGQSMSLRLRAQLLATALILSFVVMVGVIALDIVKSSIKEEIAAANKVAVQLLKAGIAPYGHDVETSSATVAYLASLGRVRANELLFYDVGGTLLYQSPPSTYKEGRDAPSWFVTLADPRPSPALIPTRSGLLKVIPDASRALVDAWDDALRLAQAVVVFFMASLAVVYWLVGRTLQPVPRILAGLEEMEQGNFSVRLPDSPIPEFGKVSHAFNRLAQTLQNSLSENWRLEQDQEVERLIRERLEEERKSVARELHDELAQCVTAIRTIAVSIGHRAKDSSPEIHGSACTIAAVAGQIYDAVHEIISRLRTVDTESVDHAAALLVFVESWRARHPETSLALYLDAGLGPLNDKIGRTVYRIVQESLTNIVRHASATRADIFIYRDGGGRLQLQVRDNGRGTASPNSKTGFGVLGMRERVASLGGGFKITSQPGQGLCVSAELPLLMEQALCR